jgi:hypothetical protein
VKREELDGERGKKGGGSTMRGKIWRGLHGGMRELEQAPL